jgi:mRNA interferase MazF
VILRGEIWWADLDEPRGSVPGYRRPVIVAQSDEFNASTIKSVIVVSLTSNLRLAEAPGNVYLEKRMTGLPRDSVANVSQILTVDRSQMIQRIGKIPASLMAEVELGIKLALALS